MICVLTAALVAFGVTMGVVAAAVVLGAPVDRD